MNAKENSNHELQDNAIELGVASIETKGPAGVDEFIGTPMESGISDQ